MVTTGGTFTLKLLPSIAPRTVAQLRRLIAAHVFDSVYFYRVERGFVAQTATADDREVPLSKEQRSLISPIPEIPGTLNSQKRKRIIMGGAYWFPHQGTVSAALLLDYDSTRFEHFVPSQPNQTRIALHGLVSF